MSGGCSKSPLGSTLCFVLLGQRPSFAIASDDWWQSQVLQIGNYYQKSGRLHKSYG